MPHITLTNEAPANAPYPGPNLSISYGPEADYSWLFKYGGNVKLDPGQSAPAEFPDDQPLYIVFMGASVPDSLGPCRYAYNMHVTNTPGVVLRFRQCTYVWQGVRYEGFYMHGESIFLRCERRCKDSNGSLIVNPMRPLPTLVRAHDADTPLLLPEGPQDSPPPE